MNLAAKKSEKSAICKDIELNFGIETKFGPLSSKTNINLKFDVIMTSLSRFQLLGPFDDHDENTQIFKNFKTEVKR